LKRTIEFEQTYPNITLVVADGLPEQLELLGRRKAQGLVAQLPYERGVWSLNSLGTLATSTSTRLPEFQGTNVLEHVLVVGSLFLLAAPLLILVKDQPQVLYVTQVLFISVLSVVIL
jgi:hypothetical protein